MKWLGYDPVDDDSWEHGSNLDDCSALVEEYWQQQEQLKVRAIIAATCFLFPCRFKRERGREREREGETER